MANERTAWHPLLGVAIREVLSPEHWQTITEHELSHAPQRIDVVVIRRTEATTAPPEVDILPSLLSDLGDHTLIHFKGPTDELERDDALSLLSYALQYMRDGRIEAPSAIVLRVLAPTLTPRFVATLKSIGGTLAHVHPGVHEGALGPFALRAIEDAVASDDVRDRLLYAFSPKMLARPGALRLATDREWRILRQIARAVEQLRDSKERLAMKDFEKTDQSLHSIYDEMVDMASVEARLRGLTPEQRLVGLKPEMIDEMVDMASVEARLRGLTPEQRLVGLKPEMIDEMVDMASVEARLRGLTPEQRLVGLAPEDALLMLPDDALRALAPEYLATLPAGVREKILARIGG